jgi:hypothetical protein
MGTSRARQRALPARASAGTSRGRGVRPARRPMSPMAAAAGALRASRCGHPTRITPRPALDARSPRLVGCAVGGQHTVLDGVCVPLRARTSKRCHTLRRAAILVGARVVSAVRPLGGRARLHMSTRSRQAAPREHSRRRCTSARWWGDERRTRVCACADMRPPRACVAARTPAHTRTHAHAHALTPSNDSEVHCTHRHF